MNAQTHQFEQAKALHAAGELRKAESIYLFLLEQNAGDVESLHHLGLLHADTNRVETGIQLLRAAIGIDGPRPWLCRNLGIILERQGNRRAAAACYRQALEETPSDHELWAALAASLNADEAHAEATVAWERAFALAPPGPAREFTFRLCWANSSALSGDRREAIRLYDELLAQNPMHVEAAFHRAVALMQEDDAVAAQAGFRRTLELNPNHARAANNLAILLQLERRYRDAIDEYQRALQEDPEFHPALFNLGSAWQEYGRPREAVAVFRKLLRQQPNHAAAWTCMGNAWLAQNEIARAILCYRRTLEIEPEEAAAEWNIGIARLLTGDLAQGWQGYERRFDVKGATPRRPFEVPEWQGESLAGKSLLLHAEQGFGDTLQFIRYAAVFAAQGAKVLVECQEALLPLLSGWDAAAGWIAAPKGPAPKTIAAARVDHLPKTDYQLPLLSAPALAGTEIDSIPYPEGYVAAPGASARKWRAWLGTPGPRLRVGLCWAGNPNHKNDRNRSIPSELLRHLDDSLPVEWISLQKGVPLPPAPEMRNAARDLRDFSDTAGLVENLDLIISVDTSVAHLAGAMGKPVWILLPYAPDWRWMLDRADSPWYSKAKLFRQTHARDWTDVLVRVNQTLKALPRPKRPGKAAILVD